MLNLMSSRGLRMLAVILIADAALSTTGCSIFKKKPVESKLVGNAGIGGQDVPTPNGQDQWHRGDDGTPVEFPMTSGVNDVHFDYDQAGIRADQQAILDKNLEYFKANPQVKIMIVGHADERGTEEYNYALAQRRAAAVQDYLLKSGVAPERLATLSKGKAEPLELGHSEAAWAKNRRGHFMQMQTRSAQ